MRGCTMAGAQLCILVQSGNDVPHLILVCACMLAVRAVYLSTLVDTSMSDHAV